MDIVIFESCHFFRKVSYRVNPEVWRLVKAAE
jgi:hypothetical protein